jgi:hypothetical protein
MEISKATRQLSCKSLLSQLSNAVSNLSLTILTKWLILWELLNVKGKTPANCGVTCFEISHFTAQSTVLTKSNPC